MALLKELNRDDLLNRYASHTFTETVTGALTKVEFKNGASQVIAESRKMNVDKAYESIRNKLIGSSSEIMYSLTTTQRDTLTVSSQVILFNTITKRIECYTGTAWESATGRGTSKPFAFGEMFENNPSGSIIDATTKKWITAGPGHLDANAIIIFDDNSAGDRLRVGLGGAGLYRLHFKTNFTNAGGNLTKATIYKNGVAQPKFADEHPGDTSQKRNLIATGFISLVVNDYLDVHVVSSTPSDVVKVYQCNLNIKRMD